MGVVARGACRCPGGVGSREGGGAPGLARPEKPAPRAAGWGGEGRGGGRGADVCRSNALCRSGGVLNPADGGPGIAWCRATKGAHVTVARGWLKAWRISAKQEGHKGSIR